MTEKETRRFEPETPLLEWVAGAVGLVLFLGVVVITLINGIKTTTPAAFTVQAVNQFQAADGYHVVIEVVNTGDQTAAAVKIGAYLKRAGGETEARDVEIEFLPPHSRRSASIVWPADASGIEIGFEVLSFREP